MLLYCVQPVGQKIVTDLKQIIDTATVYFQNLLHTVLPLTCLTIIGYELKEIQWVWSEGNFLCCMYY